MCVDAHQTLQIVFEGDTITYVHHDSQLFTLCTSTGPAAQTKLGCSVIYSVFDPFLLLRTAILHQSQQNTSDAAGLWKTNCEHTDHMCVACLLCQTKVLSH